MTQAIHPTNHAIERFNDRIKPFLDHELQSELSSIGNLKAKLSSLCNRLNLDSNETGKQRFETLLHRKRKRPIRLALVIDVKAGVLITLWCLGVVKRRKNRLQKIGAYVHEQTSH